MLLRRRPATLVAAFVSHFIVDAIAHDEPLHEDRIIRVDLVALDVLLVVLAMEYLAMRRGFFSSESLGALAACAPDVEHLLRKRRTTSVLHDLLPHARWPRRRISTSSQFAIGAIVWLALLARDASRGAPSTDA
jgi:hypothetical protein